MRRVGVAVASCRWRVLIIRLTASAKAFANRSQHAKDATVAVHLIAEQDHESTAQMPLCIEANEVQQGERTSHEQ